MRQEELVVLVNLDLLVHKDHKVQLVKLGQEVKKAPKELLDPQVVRVLQVHQDQLVKEVQLDQVVHQVHQVQLVQLER